MKTKVQSKPETKKANENIMNHIAELNSNMNYIMETLKSHADHIHEQKDLLERIRIRMGL